MACKSTYFRFIFWYNGGYVTAYGVSQNANDDLSWEKKYEYNFGVDYAFLNNRLSGSLDAYYRHTKDLLWEYTVPTPPYQFNKLLANAGQMKSMGIELAITGVPVKTRDWTWNSTFTIAFNNNTITKLSDPSKDFFYEETMTGGIGGNGLNNTNTQKLVEGESVGSFYGYHWTGQIYSNGTLVYEDVDGNGSITPADQTVIGNAQPLFTYGWNNTVRWKNLDLTVFLRGVYGNDVLNCTRWMYAPKAGDNGVSNVYMEQVSALGDGTGVVRQGKFSNYYLEDGSFLRFDNITIGYNLPLKANKYVQNLRLYLTGQNLFTITAYSGADPEVNISSVWDPGIDYVSFYPSVRNFMFGLTITL